MEKEVGKEGRGREFLRELARHMEVDRCRARDCLYDALVKMKHDHPELSGEVDRFAMEKILNEPCTPADLWGKIQKKMGRS
ncbi:MAG: hypothetical protein ACE5EI_11240 [Thermodesulfobacteriota bacterium]